MVNRMNNKSNQFAVAALAISMVTCLFAAFILGKQNSGSGSDSNQVNATPSRSDGSIAVSGTAEQRIAPDRAKLHFKVTTRNKKPSQSQLENEQLSAKVIEAIKLAGGEAKEINPGGLDITEEVKDEQNPEVPISDRTSTIEVTYFLVSSEVTVVTSHLGNVGRIVRGAFDAGATTGSVEFSTTKMRKLSDDARAAAMKAAVEKAEALTKIGGAKRGEVLNINLDDYRYSPNQYGGVDRRTLNAQNVSQAATNAQTPSEMSDQFGGGMITVSATVSATFAIVSA